MKVLFFFFNKHLHSNKGLFSELMEWETPNTWLTITLHMTLMMTSTNVIKMSDTANDNSSSQGYSHLEDHNILWSHGSNVASWFEPFAELGIIKTSEMLWKNVYFFGTFGFHCVRHKKKLFVETNQEI